MAIRLEDHKMFVQDLGMEVVPYSIAIKAVQEAMEQDDLHQSQATIEAELEKIRKAFLEINDTLEDVND
jgi:hypothetical protein